MRSYRAQGVVIRRRNLGEADRIISVFTKKYGKIRVLAKGVRRITSRRGPHLELFNHVMLFVHRGKTFDIVTEVEAISTFGHIRKNLELIGLAYYVCELIDGLCAEHQPHPRVFDLLTTTLEELNSGVIKRFEIGLLAELGFLPKHVAATNLNATFFIERILERKLKSKNFLAKLQ